MISKTLFLLLLIMISCQLSKKSDTDFHIPATLTVECTIEAVSENVEVDTSLTKRVIKDTIEFRTETIKNCCGWFEGLKLGRLNDTIRIINTNTKRETLACDCDCLFTIKMRFKKAFYDTTKNTILFFGGKKIK